MNPKTLLRTTVSICLIAGIGLSAPVSAHHRAITPDAGMAYVSPAYNNAIFGYPNLRGTVRPVAAPRLVYVDRAYGQAIFGYPRVAPDRASDLSVIHVDTAWGQAIHSYPRAGERPGTVEVLPPQAE